MLAVDTNVLVRFLTRDDPQQSDRAFELITTSEIWIGKTVLIETAWVLRRYFDAPADNVAEILANLLSAPNIFVEDRITVFEALDKARDGLDLADALHVYSASKADEFVTFDRQLAKRAQRIGLRVRAL